jgi:hypothetical protein
MRRTFPVLATALVVLGACGGPEWTTSDATVIAATADCEDGTNTQMRLRGWPPRPLAETPQDGARKAFFEDCMRRRGLTLE